jgi:hypothetical protein
MVDVAQEGALCACCGERPKDRRYRHGKGLGRGRLCRRCARRQQKVRARQRGSVAKELHGDSQRYLVGCRCRICRLAEADREIDAVIAAAAEDRR